MKSIHKVLILGSGALKIGEAGEFDYSGTQALKALKEEGKTTILVNPNIATIQTSQEFADTVYFLPVTAEFVARVIEKERPDGILLSFGGQTALNCGLALAASGVLEKHGVAVLGTPIQAVKETEDRELFAQKLAELGLKTAKGQIAHSVEEGLAIAKSLGYPVMLRVGFALGGTGSGVARTEKDLLALLTPAFTTSTSVIIEECLYGWKEIEYEVVRDGNDNCITVCNMENFDPVGIHTGESIVIAPSQTLTNDEYYSLRDIAIRVIRSLKIVGECNIQYALNPKTGDYRIIEVNARLSRSSALASKATGYPLAYVAAKLALGKTLPELRNAVTGKTSAFFEPALDYVVVKFPRWDLEKYEHVDLRIGSEMKSVGEVMSIARTFKEALQKAIRMLNQGYDGVVSEKEMKLTVKELELKLKQPDPRRLFAIGAAMAKGMSVKKIATLTSIDPWFLLSVARMVETYVKLTRAKTLTSELLGDAKRQGFSDKHIGFLRGQSEDEVRAQRKAAGIVPIAKRIDTMAGEFPAQTNYLYLTYAAKTDDYVPTASESKVMVLGGGPYAIGTSVEFDWCAVNTVMALKKHGKKTIMVNCNPETVSTDYDNTDYLYFEELSLERVLDIYDREQSPVVVSVGGQVPNNLAPHLDKRGVPLLGSNAKTILQAEDRRTFSSLLDSLSIDQPEWAEAHSEAQSLKEAKRIGFPILLRPSFVLSGKAMLVIETEEQLASYLKNFEGNIRDYSLVMTKFLQGATECDFDGVAQDGNIIIHALSEHVEKGGVHSGDATLVLPSYSLTPTMKEKLKANAGAIVKALKLNGPFNIQFLVHEEKSYVIECNVRASRSLPFVSKSMGVNFISVATEVALGKSVAPITPPVMRHVAVKAPQFSFRRLRGADPVLRVEMSSTGEVAAFGRDRFEAYLKAILATGMQYPTKKAVFLSLGGDHAKQAFLPAVKRLAEMKFVLYATAGTHAFLDKHGITSKKVGKMYEDIHPNYQDLLKHHDIGFSVVLPERFTDAESTRVKKGMSDGYVMRRLSIDLGLPIFTNSESATLFIESMQQYTVAELSL
jgi:carbamoyl-phosphate synthase large subunit